MSKHDPRRRRLQFLTDDALEVAFLGEMGWHSKAIGKRTGLSEYQVNYRLHAYGITRRAYRDGTSFAATRAADMCRSILKPIAKADAGRKFYR